MIQLDPRVGSGELLPYFSAYDVEVTCDVNLEFGDACWWGDGPEGSCFVGMERKIITDLVASMRSDRLSGFQLGGLTRLYDYIYLVVEGGWRSGKTGEIEVPTRDSGWVPLRVGSRPVLFREVDHYLATLEHVCNVTIVRSYDRPQTVAFLVSRYKWWQKEWGKHDSWRAIYAPGPPVPTHIRRGLSIPSPTPAQEVAARLPGIRSKAWEVGKRFESPWELVNATEKELAATPGIGKVGAKKIYAWLREKKRSGV